MFTQIKNYLKRYYSYPQLKQLDLNSPQTIGVHKRIIENNALLRRHYLFVYGVFKKNEDRFIDLAYPSLEIGSGAGFLKEIIPSVITSDLVAAGGIDRIEDAQRLSFKDASLKAVYANGVLHHMPDPSACLKEIERVLIPGGVFICNEPSSTLFGYFMNRNFHAENTDKTILPWRLEKGRPQGRLTGANMAMPYNIFIRDRKIFKDWFPGLKIISVIYHDFLRYTLSGGLSFRPFVPGLFFPAVNSLEIAARPLMPVIGNNMIVTIKKIERKGIL